MTIVANNEFWNDFFDTLKELPTLWQTKSVDYKNRMKKKQAWSILLEKYKQIDKEANYHSVKRKYHNIRACFRREQKNVESSILAANGSDSIYIPSLWYYYKLDFLRDEDVDLVEEKSDVDKSIMQPHKRKLSDPIFDASALAGADSGSETMEDTEEYLEDEPPFPMPTPVKSKPTEEKKKIIVTNSGRPIIKIKKDLTKNNHLTEKRSIEGSTYKSNSSVKWESVNNSPKSPQLMIREKKDDAAVYAESWAVAFRKLDGNQQLLAKKAIDDILFLGLMGELKMNYNNRQNSGDSSNLNGETSSIFEYSMSSSPHGSFFHSTYFKKE